ncbi:hypothetical protein CLV52_1516 [Amnibacterium kyonggiense]|uniref:Integral membrane protein n=1 Tax=Amnibacterium kyonggiense TaxID=595671 RepID=A0A4V3EBF3_9MICO|nr:hypothetical protein CLV52_1516 [Amnibacterium kyonggiense]
MVTPHDAEGLEPAHDAPPPADADRGRGGARRWSAVVLLALVALVVPPTIAAAWLHQQVSDPDRFVAMLAPLAEDASFRTAVTDRTSTAVLDAAGVDALARRASDALAGIPLPAPAVTAVETLSTLAAREARAAVHDVVRGFVESDRFPRVWEDVVRTAQIQGTGLLTGRTDQALAADASGHVVVSLAPVIEQLRPRLERAGFTGAALIPAVDATIPVGTIDGLPAARTGYRALSTAALVLPWLCAGLLALAFLVSPARRRTVLHTGVALLTAGVLLVVAAIVGRGMLLPALSPEPLPADVAGPLIAAVLGTLTPSVIALVLAGLLTVLLGLAVAGPRGAGPAALQRPAVGAARAVGAAVRRARPVVVVSVVAAGVLAVALVRPLTVAAALWILVAALALLLADASLERLADPRSAAVGPPARRDPA